MDNRKPGQKRTQEELDSDSESEISFNPRSQDTTKRLRLQPEKMSPGPNDPPTPDFVAQVMKHFDQKTAKMTANFKSELEPIKRQLTNHEQEIDQINHAIKRLDQNASANAIATNNALKEEKYWTTRRSGCFWAIQGGENDDLKLAAMDFISKALLIPASEHIQDRIEVVKRTRTSFSSKIKEEVLVIFDTVSTRDYVFSHAKNLAKLSPIDRKLNGMRLDYPAHLGSDYRVLDAYGAKLRSRFGEGFRRSIKFNDDEMSLYMDICLPRKEEWIRVTAGMAKEDRGTATIEDEETARRKIQEGLNMLPLLTGANSVPVQQPSGDQQMRNIWGSTSSTNN